MTKGFHL